MAVETRIEKDALGERRLPGDALYGIHALRSSENFDAGDERLPPALIYAMARLKKACAAANADLAQLPREKADAIMQAADEVMAGEHDDQFIIDIYQAGSGTSSNMNVNEVLANRAAQRLGGAPGDRQTVHPNDDVNRGQSTNNVFPSAIRLAVIEQHAALADALTNLSQAFAERAEAFAHVLKSGRTHLQDAVPVTLGCELAAYAHTLARHRERLLPLVETLRELGIGGNAVGTGINTPPEFRDRIIHHLNQPGDVYRKAENGLAATQFLTDIAGYSSGLRLLAADLLKMTNDLRLLSSGPNTGLGDIKLPAMEPGSSIMPGKVNPGICEAANMVCLQVMGLDHVVSAALAAGQLELNTHMPLIGRNVLKEMSLLTRAMHMLTERCVKGIEARVDRCRAHFESSAGLATVLNPLLGYDKVSELVKESLHTGVHLIDLIKQQHIMEPEELDRLLMSATGCSGQPGIDKKTN